MEEVTMTQGTKLEHAQTMYVPVSIIIITCINNNINVQVNDIWQLLNVKTNDCFGLR